MRYSFLSFWSSHALLNKKKTTFFFFFFFFFLSIRGPWDLLDKKPADVKLHDGNGAVYRCKKKKENKSNFFFFFFRFLSLLGCLIFFLLYTSYNIRLVCVCVYMLSVV